MFQREKAPWAALEGARFGSPSEVTADEDARLRDWDTAFNDCDDALEVDYPIIQARLNAIRTAKGKRPADFALDLHLIETGGQQLEKATLAILLQEKDLPLSLHDLDSRQPSGQSVINALERHVFPPQGATTTLLRRRDAMTSGASVAEIHWADEHPPTEEHMRLLKHERLGAWSLDMCRCDRPGWSAETPCRLWLVRWPCENTVLPSRFYSLIITAYTLFEL